MTIKNKLKKWLDDEDDYLTSCGLSLEEGEGDFEAQAYRIVGEALAEIKRLELGGEWCCTNGECGSVGIIINRSYQALAVDGGPVCGECGDDMALTAAQ